MRRRGVVAAPEVLRPAPSYHRRAKTPATKVENDGHQSMAKRPRLDGTNDAPRSSVARHQHADWVHLDRQSGRFPPRRRPHRRRRFSRAPRAPRPPPAAPPVSPPASPAGARRPAVGQRRERRRRRHRRLDHRVRETRQQSRRRSRRSTAALRARLAPAEGRRRRALFRARACRLSRFLLRLIRELRRPRRRSPHSRAGAAAVASARRAENVAGYAPSPTRTRRRRISCSTAVAATVVLPAPIAPSSARALTGDAPTGAVDRVGHDHGDGDATAGAEFRGRRPGGQRRDRLAKVPTSSAPPSRCRRLRGLAGARRVEPR